MSYYYPLTTNCDTLRRRAYLNGGAARLMKLFYVNKQGLYLMGMTSRLYTLTMETGNTQSGMTLIQK